MFEAPVKLFDIAHEDDGSTWEAIKACEKILEKDPEDTMALASLANAYERIGDSARAHELRLQSVEILERDQKWADLQEMAEHLCRTSPEDQKFLKLRDLAAEHLKNEGDDSASRDKPAGTTRAPLAFDLNAELDLAWLLLQNDMITQEQYEKAISGLTESRMNTMSESTLSLLQELAAMERIKMDKILGFLSAYTNTAYIEVDGFEIEEEIAARIPLSQSRRIGVLAFAAMGEELMAVVLNPVDENLKKRTAEFLGRKVHFFLTSPESFQKAIARLEAASKKR